MYKLPDLPYEFSALEPYLDGATMKIHQGKHHQGYVDKLNAALAGHDDLSSKSIEGLIADLSLVPEDIRTAVRNNGGGHVNHSLFWSVMKPNGGSEPEGELAEEVKSAFGDFETFKEKFSDV